jgi:hypothetical protein
MAGARAQALGSSSSFESDISYGVDGLGAMKLLFGTMRDDRRPRFFPGSRFLRRGTLQFCVSRLAHQVEEARELLVRQRILGCKRHTFL